jgi:hypothetical protein
MVKWIMDCFYTEISGPYINIIIPARGQQLLHVKNVYVPIPTNSKSSAHVTT